MEGGDAEPEFIERLRTGQEQALMAPGTAVVLDRGRRPVRLFIATSYITAGAAEYFGPPATARSSRARTSRSDQSRSGQTGPWSVQMTPSLRHRQKGWPIGSV